MLHIAKLIRRHYQDQSDYVIVCLVVLGAAAVMVGIALLLLQ